VLSNHTIEVIARCLCQAHGREICGYLLQDWGEKQEFFAVENLANDFSSFFVSCSNFNRMEGYAERHDMRVVAFVHSHAYNLELSSLDIAARSDVAIPWIVVVLSQKRLTFKVHEP
jgi:proteasome lid subunit RPN8/RPN11